MSFVQKKICAILLLVNACCVFETNAMHNGTSQLLKNIIKTCTCAALSIGAIEGTGYTIEGLKTGFTIARGKDVFFTVDNIKKKEPNNLSNVLIYNTLGTLSSGFAVFSAHLLHNLINAKWNNQAVSQAAKSGSGVSLFLTGLSWLGALSLRYLKSHTFGLNGQPRQPPLSKKSAVLTGSIGAACLYSGYKLLSHS